MAAVRQLFDLHLRSARSDAEPSLSVFIAIAMNISTGGAEMIGTQPSRSTQKDAERPGARPRREAAE